MRVRVIPGGIALLLGGCGLSVMGTPSEDAPLVDAGPPLVLAEAGVSDAIADAVVDPGPPVDGGPVVLDAGCPDGAPCNCGGSPCPAGSTSCFANKCYFTLTVVASIDGRSDFVIHGNTVTWNHDDKGPPGPTTLNGQVWTPTWSVNPDGCQCSPNNPFTIVAAIPKRNQTLSLNGTSGRNPFGIVRQPDGVNATFAVHFDDNDKSGRADYGFTVTWETR